MEYFRDGNLNDLDELKRISQTAYMEAFNDLIDTEDVKEYVSNKYTLKHLEEEIEDKANYFLLYYVDDLVAGYMKYILKPDSLEIERLYMLKNFKGMGVGSQFMTKAENIAKLNGKNILTLGVLEINKPAISFYKKRGFMQFACESVLIGKTKHSLLLMKKELV